MSHFKRRSLLASDTCPVCRRRFNDINQHQAAPRHLSLSLWNEHFELKFTGNVCQECYCKLAGTPQQSLFTTAQQVTP